MSIYANGEGVLADFTSGDRVGGWHLELSVIH